jgi:hypothetical protein
MRELCKLSFARIAVEIAVAMKWHNRTAQAFRPGITPPSRFALKGRPNRLLVTSPQAVTEKMITLGTNRAYSVALSGRTLLPIYPGLKAWAVLLCHFMARPRSFSGLALPDSPYHRIRQETQRSVPCEMARAGATVRNSKKSHNHHYDKITG